MKIRPLPLLFAFILLCPAAHAADRKPSWFEGLEHPLPIIPALPADFIVVSLWPQTKTTGQFNMEEGVLWAPPRTAHHFEFEADKEISHAKDPMFYVQLSAEVQQTPGTDTFNLEKDLKSGAGFAAAGLTKGKTSKIKWGKYPVLVITGENQMGEPVFIAYLGLNSPDGWVIAINYIVPRGKGHPTDEEKKIWETFVNGTKAPQ